MCALREADLPEEGSYAPVDLEDKQLAVAFKAGDGRAYDLIYLRHTQRVHSVCRRMLRDAHDAEEAVQETFLRVFRALPSFNGQYQLGAWITRIATNVCLDNLRSQGRHPADLTPFDELQLLQGECSEDGEPESVQIKRFESRRVHRVLDALPPLHKAAIVLRDFEGLSYEEVSQALSISESQTKALIHRARQGFKRQWAAQVASLFFPAKLFDRIRTADFATREQAAHALSPASQAIANCNVALQQCGQFMSERVATAMSAVVITTTAAATVIAPGAAPSFSPEAAPEREITVAVASEEPDERKAQTARPEKKKAEAEVPPMTDGETTPEPAATEAPEPTTPTPAPTEPPAEEPKPTETAEPGNGGGEPVTPVPTEPTTFTSSATLAGFEGATPCSGCLRGNSEIGQSGRLNAEGTDLESFTQKIQGSIAVDGSPTYGFELSHSGVNGAEHGMTFRLLATEGSFDYQATGSWTERSVTDWGGVRYTMSGTYQRTGGASRSASVPTAGSYTVQMTFSPKSSRIWSTTVSFQEL